MSLLDTLPKSSKDGVIYDAEVVHGLLPQKDPFAFVDEINELYEEDGKKAIKATKYILGTEGYFRGHFPTEPVMPGVLQIETMAQAGNLLAALCFEEEVKGKRPAFMGVNGVRFRRAVKPGDVLSIHATLEKFRRGIMVFKADITCNGEPVSSAEEVTAMMV